MPGAHAPSPDLPRHLDTLYRRFPFERSLAQDPLSCIRPFGHDPVAAERAGLFASTLAIGNTTAIRGAFARLADAFEGDFVAAVNDRSRPDRLRRLRGFRHRWIRGDQLAYLGDRLAGLAESYPSLESVFREGFDRGGGYTAGLDALVKALRGDAGPGRGRSIPPPKGYRALFPTPLARPASSCKRLALFLRWMVRPQYPDLGIWTRVPTGELRIPLDQHVHWIAYHLGLTQRRTRGWSTVEEVTEALRRIDPIDPVKFDFVLCHTGISGDCPKERDLRICGACSVRPDCRLWRGVHVAG